MFLDQDQMYLRMCNVNKEKRIFGKFTVFVPLVPSNVKHTSSLSLFIQ